MIYQAFIILCLPEFTHGLLLVMDPDSPSESAELMRFTSGSWGQLSAGNRDGMWLARYEIGKIRHPKGRRLSREQLLGMQVQCRFDPRNLSSAKDVNVDAARLTIKVSPTATIRLAAARLVAAPYDKTLASKPRGKKKLKARRMGDSEKWRDRSNQSRPSNVDHPYQGGRGG